MIPLVVRSPYYLDLFIVILINAALAMTFVMMLRTGLISLGIAAFYGIGAYASAELVMKLHISFWLSLPISAIIAALFGLILGFPLIKNAGFTFVILTTVIGMLFVVAIGNIPALGGYNGIPSIPPPNPVKFPFLPVIDFSSRIQFFYLALLLFIVVILIINAFYSAWTGRAWTAIGLNPRLAQSLGIDVFRYRLLAFVVACGIAGLLGSFYAHYRAFIIPTAYTMFTTIYIQVYAILGGIEFATLGPIIGSVLMTFFPELVRMTKELEPFFNGALLILLIIFLPKGLLSLFKYRPSLVRWCKNIFRLRKLFTASGSGKGGA